MVNVVNFIGSVVKAPTGLWATILNWIESGVVNYGWVIILFTLLVKVCLSPMDFLMKFTTKKQTLVQQKLAPQIARINKKYQNDRNTAQLQINALYKKEGFNVFASCIIMLLNLVITMTVFFTLFSSLRTMSAYKAINQYDAIQKSYVETLASNGTTNFINLLKDHSTYYTKTGDVYVLQTGVPYDTFKVDFEGDPGSQENIGILKTYYSVHGQLTDEQKAILTNNYLLISENNYISFETALNNVTTEVTPLAVKQANKTWNKVKDNWLWIGNIWVSDSYKSPLPTYNDLKEIANNSKTKEYKTYVNNIDKNLYNTITTSVHKQNERWNGYFILAILAGATTFLSQWVSELLTKTKNKKVNQFIEETNPTGGTMKFMKILLPAMMVIFVLTSSSAFSIYIVFSSIVSMGISALTNVIVNACYKNKQAEVLAFLEKETLRSMKKNKRNM